MNIIISFFTGYLIGSVPTAFLILKASYGIDVRKHGTGNVGAMNSFEVTESRKTGFLVFFIDFVKGTFSVLLVKFLLEENFILSSFSLWGAVLAHCYSPWIGFKGGRGLATAAGGAFFLYPLFLAGWLTGWSFFFYIKRNIITANFLTSLFILFFSVIFVGLFCRYSYIAPLRDNDFRLSVLVLMAIIITRHISPLLGVIREK